jgi:hypothetical protein
MASTLGKGRFEDGKIAYQQQLKSDPFGAEFAVCRHDYDDDSR